MASKLYGVNATIIMFVFVLNKYKYKKEYFFVFVLYSFIRPVVTYEQFKVIDFVYPNCYRQTHKYFNVFG